MDASIVTANPSIASNPLIQEIRDVYAQGGIDTIQQRAKAILDVLRKQKRLEQFKIDRPDELELLTIAAEGGGTGVAAALRDQTKVLSALAALGIGLETLSSEASRDGGETPL